MADSLQGVVGKRLTYQGSNGKFDAYDPARVEAEIQENGWLHCLPDFELEQRLRKASNSATSGAQGSLGDALITFERQLILDALSQNDFNLSRAAQQLDITRHALRYRMSRLNITLDTVVDEDSDAASSSYAR